MRSDALRCDAMPSTCSAIAEAELLTRTALVATRLHLTRHRFTYIRILMCTTRADSTPLMSRYCFVFVSLFRSSNLISCPLPPPPPPLHSTPLRTNKSIHSRNRCARRYILVRCARTFHSAIDALSPSLCCQSFRHYRSLPLGGA